MFTNREQIMPILEYIKNNSGHSSESLKKIYNDSTIDTFKTTIYVDQLNGSNDNDGKTKDSAFETIQKAWGQIPLLYYNSYEIVIIGSIDARAEDIFKRRICLGKRCDNEDEGRLKCGISIIGYDSSSLINIESQEYTNIMCLNMFKLSNFKIFSNEEICFSDCNNLRFENISFPYSDDRNKMIFDNCNAVFLNSTRFKTIEATNMSKLYMTGCTSYSDSIKLISNSCSCITCEDSNIGSQYVELTGGKVNIVTNN